ncbi:MAG: hypothetical protein PUB05_00120 [Firmicutes bacterium]|nr:hypothetical protein [Bacillota bacterium]
MRQSKKVAFCSLIAALSCAILVVTRVFATASYACSALAGLLSITVVLEFGYKWALAEFAVSAIMAAIFSSPDAAITYILLFGYYPVLKGFIESRIRRRPIQWGIKMVYFNAVMVLCYILTVAIVGPIDDMGFLGAYGLPLLALVCNIAYVIYDIGTSRIIAGYNYKLRGRVHKLLK